MTQRSDRPVAGLDPTVDAMLEVYDGAADAPRTLLIEGRDGGGRKTAIDRLLQRITERGDPPTAIRLRGQPSDDGIKTLGRFYSSFVGAVARGPGSQEALAALDAAAEASNDERVGGWLSGIAGSMRELRAHASGQFQIKLPGDNPWLGLLYAFDVLGPRRRWIIDLFELGHVTSPSFWAFLTALIGRVRARQWRVLFVVTPGRNLYSEKGEGDQAGPLSFLGSLFDDSTLISLPPLSRDAVAELIEDTYRPHRFPAAFAPRLHELSGGHAESLHELLDALEEDETITWDDKGYALSDLEDVDLEVLVPIPAEDDEEEGEEDAAEDGAEAPADGRPDDAFLEAVLHVAAHEGRTFSSALVRTYLEAGEDAVDDALDAMPHLVEEVQYHQALGTWLYRFRFGFYRDWYRANPPEGFKKKSQEICRRLGTLAVQTYAPASYEYLVRAAELFTEGADARGARNVLAMALSAEPAALATFALETTERFEDSPWPDGLVRLLITSQADRAVKSSPTPEARAAIERARTWAAAHEDADTAAFAELLDCRLLMREGDMPRAKEQGIAALNRFKQTGDKTRQGETLNQLALISLNTGDARSARQFVKDAQKASTIPPVKAHSQYILGVLLRRQGQLPQALEAFTRSVELSEQAGNLVLSLEAMLNRGECALMAGRSKDIAPMLERALEMSRALRSTTRERLAARLLCQAEAARGRGDAALEMAQHALELTRELGLEDQEDIDLYHCGVFAVLAGKTEHGLDYLQAARTSCEKSDKAGLLPEVLFNLGQVKLSTGDADGSRTALEQALGVVRQRKDTVRELRILEGLGVALSELGQHQAAAGRFKEAADKALGPQAKEFRKSMRARIAQEQSKAHSAGPSA